MYQTVCPVQVKYSCLSLTLSATETVCLVQTSTICVMVCTMHLTSIHWYKTYRTRRTCQVQTCPVCNLLLCNIKLTSLADKVLQNFLATMTGRPNSMRCGVNFCGGE